MWIVKIGGSWINNSNLFELIKHLNRLSKKVNLIIVNGGGCFSDSVRSVYENKRMSEKTAHFIALKATEMFSHILKEINNNISLISEIENLNDLDKGLKIWMPSIKLKNDPNFIKTWESTSDSVAAWLHKKTNSKGLLFVKSLTFGKKKYKLNYLQEQGVLDKNVGMYLSKQKNIKIIGTEIINLLRDASNWNELYSNVNEVEL